MAGSTLHTAVRWKSIWSGCCKPVFLGAKFNPHSYCFSSCLDFTSYLYWHFCRPCSCRPGGRSLWELSRTGSVILVPSLEGRLSLSLLPSQRPALLWVDPASQRRWARVYIQVSFSSSINSVSSCPVSSNLSSVCTVNYKYNTISIFKIIPPRWSDFPFCRCPIHSV